MALEADCAGLDAQALCVLAIPGWGSDERVFLPLAQALQWPCWGLNLPDAPDWPSACDALAAQCMAWRSARPSGLKMLWLGWSLGGGLALALANRFAQSTQAAVAIAANPLFVAEPDTGWPAMSPAVFAAFETDFKRDPRVTYRRFLALQAQGARDATFVRQQQREFLPGQPAASSGTQLGWLRQDWRSLADNTAIPFLQLNAEQDALVPARSDSSACPYQLLPGSHCLLLETPGALAQAIVDWVAR